MKYKHIEASREVRLWIGQVIVPACIAFGVAMTNPQFKEAVTEKASAVKKTVKGWFNR